MSIIIKSFAVSDENGEPGDMFYIKHASSNFTMNDNDKNDGKNYGSSGINFLWPNTSDENFKKAKSLAAEGKAYNNLSPIFTYELNGTSVQKLKEIYPVYMPKRNIFLTVKSLWRDFVQNPVEEVNT